MKDRKSMVTILVVSFVLVFCVGLVSGAAAQGLVKEGVEIVDAKTFAAAKKEGKLMLYGTFPSGVIKPVLSAFESDTGLKVDYMRLPTRKMYDRVASEFAAGRFPADYVDLTDLPLIETFVQKGILNHPYKIPIFDRIPAELKDPEGRWYVLIRPVLIIGINKALVKEADYPSSWKDLLDPKWKGKIGLASIDAGGSAFIEYTYLRKFIDPDYWPKLAGQKPRIYPSASPTATDLVRGETSVVILPAELFVRQIKQGAPIKAIFPSEGFASFPITGGITSTAKHPNAAKVYLNWMTSTYGGKMIGNAGAYPLHPDAPAPSTAGLNYPPASKVWNMDVQYWKKWREPHSKEWRKIFGQ